MSFNFRSTTAAAAIVAASAFAGGASAASLDITAITPSWANVDPAAGITVDNVPPTISLRWGTGVGGGAQSGYDFVAGTTPINGIAPDTNILLGEFDHLNFPITGTTLNTVDLAVDIQIGGGGPLVSSTFAITHDETPNVQNQCPADSPPCDDVVTIANSLGSDTFTLGGVTYNFSVLGFSQDNGNTITTSFFTTEGQSNVAKLYATYTVAAVPLPAAAWMLLAGVGGLAALRRRKKAA